MRFLTHFQGTFLVGLTILCLTGCSVRKMAVNQIGDALSGTGTAFTSDDDLELVKAALPFSLKLMESILAETPRHEGLLLATASGFTQYAYAFVQPEMDRLEETDFYAADKQRQRARRLYLRARDYGLRALSIRHRGFEEKLRENPAEAVVRVSREDVPELYWTAVAWGAAIAISKDDPEMIGQIPQVEFLIYRALELDESHNHGEIHSFLITFEMSRPAGVRGAIDRARKHFQRAMELSSGQQAGPLVALAQSVCVQEQNVVEFKSLLNRALAINPDARPEWRLVNLLMQERARWLLSRTEDLFLINEQE